MIPDAIKIAKSINDSRITIIYGKFSKIRFYTNKLNLTGKINGILIDLGMSSLQLDNPQRGFSYIKNGPIDMRMDNTKGESALDWLSKASINDIIQVLKNFGEEKFAKYIAKIIYIQNKKKKLTNTDELSNIIINAIPCIRKNKHLAARSFQAIRIYINQELEELKKVLHNVASILASKGRLSIISFHSLESKLIKKFIVKYSNKRLNFLLNLPLTDKQILEKSKKFYQFKKICKIIPSLHEINYNIRSRNSVMRCIEKI